jgi:hypothetical protein
MDGSDLRKISTVKEFFATHLILSWASKQQDTTPYESSQVLDFDRLTKITLPIDNLIYCQDFALHVADLANHSSKSDDDKYTY